MNIYAVYSNTQILVVLFFLMCEFNYDPIAIFCTFQNLHIVDDTVCVIRIPIAGLNSLIYFQFVCVCAKPNSHQSIPSDAELKN